GTVKDEAMRAGIGVEQLVRPGPMPDYFSAMDYTVPQPTRRSDDIQGRNMWLVWTGGNDKLWDRLTVDSLGTFDLLKTISSHPRSATYGSFNGDGGQNTWEDPG